MGNHGVPGGSSDSVSWVSWRDYGLVIWVNICPSIIVNVWLFVIPAWLMLKRPMLLLKKAIGALLAHELNVDGLSPVRQQYHVVSS